MKTYKIKDIKVKVGKVFAEIAFSKEKKIIVSENDKIYKYIKLYLKEIEQESLTLKVDSANTETYDAFYVWLTCFTMAHELITSEVCGEFTEYMLNKINNIYKDSPDDEKIISDDAMLYDAMEVINKK